MITYLLATICIGAALLLCYCLIAISGRAAREEEKIFQRDCLRGEEDEAWELAEKEWPKLRERLRREGYLKD